MFKIVISVFIFLLIAQNVFAFGNLCAAKFLEGQKPLDIVLSTFSSGVTKGPHYWNIKVRLALKTLGVPEGEQADVLTAMLESMDVGPIGENHLSELRILVYALAEEQPINIATRIIHPFEHQVAPRSLLHMIENLSGKIDRVVPLEQVRDDLTHAWKQRIQDRIHELETGDAFGVALTHANVRGGNRYDSDFSGFFRMYRDIRGHDLVVTLKDEATVEELKSRLSMYADSYQQFEMRQNSNRHGSSKGNEEVLSSLRENLDKNAKALRELLIHFQSKEVVSNLEIESTAQMVRLAPYHDAVNFGTTTNYRWSRTDVVTESALLAKFQKLSEYLKAYIPKLKIKD